MPGRDPETRLSASPISRRAFLKWSCAGASVMLLAACQSTRRPRRLPAHLLPPRQPRHPPPCQRRRAAPTTAPAAAHDHRAATTAPAAAPTTAPVAAPTTRARSHDGTGCRANGCAHRGWHCQAVRRSNRRRRRHHPPARVSVLSWNTVRSGPRRPGPPSSWSSSRSPT